MRRVRLLTLLLLPALPPALSSCSDDAPKPQSYETALEASTAWMNARPKPKPTTSPTTNPAAIAATQEFLDPVAVRVEMRSRIEVEGRRPGDFARQFFPVATLITGEQKNVTLGSPDAGAALELFPAYQGDDGTIPVQVYFNLWGSNYGNASNRWVVKFEDGQTQTLRTATSTGDRLSLYLTLKLLQTSR